MTSCVGAIGFKDVYDFNSRPWLGKNSRSFSAEIKTRAVKNVGQIHGASDYIITFGITPR